jgi:hypothetical protein
MNLGYEFSPFFSELRDREKVAQGVHHYHFASPPYSSYDGNLNYGLEPNVLRQDYRFRVETDPTQRTPGTLRVTLGNVHESDVIEIDLNRKLLPEYPQWAVVGGRLVGYRRIPIGSEQDGVRNYCYEASLADLPLRKGENSLGLRVVSRGMEFKAPFPTFQGLEVLI